MSLAEELKTVRGAVEGAVPAPIFQAIGASIVDLEATGLAQRAVGVGGAITLPVLVGIDGDPRDLAALAGGRALVLIFYRGGWCPYCNVTLRAYAKALPDIEAAGGTLIAITPETPEQASETAGSQELGFPVLVDRGNAFARSLGLVFSLPEDLRPLYREIGIDLPRWNGDESHELPIPAIYVLDPSGRVAFAHVAADFTTRAEPADVVAALHVLGAAGAKAIRAA